jgi:hypothetical protein
MNRAMRVTIGVLAALAWIFGIPFLLSALGLEGKWFVFFGSASYLVPPIIVFATWGRSGVTSRRTSSMGWNWVGYLLGAGLMFPAVVYSSRLSSTPFNLLFWSGFTMIGLTYCARPTELEKRKKRK